IRATSLLGKVGKLRHGAGPRLIQEGGAQLLPPLALFLPGTGLRCCEGVTAGRWRVEATATWGGERGLGVRDPLPLPFLLPAPSPTGAGHATHPGPCAGAPGNSPSSPGSGGRAQPTQGKHQPPPPCLPPVCREAEGLCEVLAATQGAPLALAPELTRAVTNVVCALCFNSCYRRGDPEFETMLQYSQGIVDTVGKESLVDIFPWLQYFPNKDLAWLRQCIKARDELLQRKFTQHKEAFCSDSVSDLMDALLRAKFNMENNNSRLDPGLELTDDHLLMTVGDIFGAGVETTTTTLKWAIIYMLHYPEVQRKIQEELDQQLGLERRPQLSDRQRLPYLEATISEVLRIRPIAPLLIPHVALVDSSIGEYVIPKGAHVIVNVWAIHHDRDEWDKPEEFNPGRFLDERGQRIYSPTTSYMPFGLGVRACLGEVLAKMELFLLLSWILQRFTLELPAHHPLPSLEGKFGIVLQATGFDIKAVPREPGRAGP
ncbi:PREDICTED: steroid 17-alpha-hydroxylase/17,20 lyase, partial [Crocodylus porosus]|uniref:steroid 17-alpha-hydroxylase/17,20 lyase n=1 Tax=Crocodylus porosus TaxID=8502 RepID=UPI000940567F